MSRQLRTNILSNGSFLLTGLIGGWLLSLTGLPLAWLLGSMLATLIWRIVGLGREFSKKWRVPAQLIMAVQLGSQMKASILVQVVQQIGWVLAMIGLTVIAGIAVGMFVWRMTKTDPVTALFATVPGGATEMAVVADELHGQAILVAMLQSVRMMLVITLIPAISLLLGAEPHALSSYAGSGILSLGAMLVTIAFFGVAILGWRVAKKLRFFTPALIGGVLFVTIIQLGVTGLADISLDPYWPNDMITIAQILLGASIGSGFQTDQVKGGMRFLVWGSVGNISLILFVAVMSYVFSGMIGIDGVTPLLAFAPGGVSEMAIAAYLYDADASFVTSVQLLRMLIVMLVTPFVLRWISGKMIVKITGYAEGRM